MLIAKEREKSKVSAVAAPPSEEAAE